MQTILEKRHTRTRVVRVIAIVVGLAALQGIAFVIYRLIESDRPRRLTGTSFAVERVAPQNVPLKFERADLSQWTLATKRGRPVVLHFWATWCGPCRTELPTLVAQSKWLAAQGIEVVLASVDEDWVVIRTYFEDGPMPDNLSRVVGGQYKELTTGILPETLFLDASGYAHARARGARDWSSAAAIDFLRSLSR